MKIYNPNPIHIVRVNIKRQPEAFEHINFCETSIEETIQFIQDALIYANIAHPFVRGNKISIEVREAMGSQNGKSKSFSFYSEKNCTQILQCINEYIIKQQIKNWI